MHNLKKIKGTFKGIIGECLFKSTSNWVFLTRSHNRKFFFNAYQQFLIKEQITFLDQNWYSLDAIECSFKERKITIYEIKTKNKYAFDLGYKPKASASTIIIYEKALTLGFVVKSAEVILYENWNFCVEIKNYSKNNYCIDKPKKYDKAVIQNPGGIISEK